MHINQSWCHDHSPRIEHLVRPLIPAMLAAMRAILPWRMATSASVGETLRWIDDMAAAYQEIVGPRAASLRIQQTLRVRSEAANQRRQKNLMRVRNCRRRDDDDDDGGERCDGGDGGGRATRAEGYVSGAPPGNWIRDVITCAGRAAASASVCAGSRPSPGR